MRFRRHNLQLFEEMYPHYKNRSKMIAVVKEGRRQFEEQMARERVEQAQRRREGGEGPSWGDAGAGEEST
jgi:glutathione-regulated potassium-efflux system ancillary protein KefC